MLALNPRLVYRPMNGLWQERAWRGGRHDLNYIAARRTQLHAIVRKGEAPGAAAQSRRRFRGGGSSRFGCCAACRTQSLAKARWWTPQWWMAPPYLRRGHYGLFPGSWPTSAASNFVDRARPWYGPVYKTKTAKGLWRRHRGRSSGAVEKLGSPYFAAPKQHDPRGHV